MQSLGASCIKRLDRALDQFGIYAVRESSRGAPRSPTKAQYVAWLQARRKTPGRSKSRQTAFFPGRLERSIGYERGSLGVKGGGFVDVFVGEQSPARAYANRMHFDHYNLGPGSVVKAGKTGRPVGRLFIERAVDSNEAFKKAQNLIDLAVAKAYAAQKSQ